MHSTTGVASSNPSHSSSRPTITTTYPDTVERLRDTEYPMLKGKAYLDHGGATIYARSLVESFSQRMLTGLYGNPHSDSAPAALSGSMVDAAREKALRFFGANPEDYDLIFVANATAAIKLVMESFRDLAGNDNYHSSSTNHFRYAYHKDSHTSIVGVRELTDNHWCFRSDEEVEAWLGSSNMGNDTLDSRLTKEEDEKPCLFAYPGQSNMTGRRLPLDWISKLRKSSLSRHRNAYSLLDAAALAMNASLKNVFRDVDKAPDFTCLSFYKIFGFPDLGALIVRRSSGHVLTWRRYFGGGTVDMVSVMDKQGWHRVKDYTLHDGLEDGTLPFHSILALDCAIDVHERLYGSMDNISKHTQFLAKRLYDGLRRLYHNNGQPLIAIHNDSGNNYDDATKQGATIAFNLKDSNSEFIPFQDVEQSADSKGIYLRSGGLCNPGGVATYLNLRPWEFKRNWSSGYRCGSNDSPKLIAGKPAGVVRASLGAMSTTADVDTFVKFLAETYCEKEVKVDKTTENWNVPIDYERLHTQQPSLKTSMMANGDHRTWQLGAARFIQDGGEAPTARKEKEVWRVRQAAAA
ncbi:pyridoxal phosphate-dependent transferase [Xylogone sp. PMI_703]|nr:pyridoxal phosphate-dependent transferase [Xylogone sp. PMI_703]